MVEKHIIGKEQGDEFPFILIIDSKGVLPSCEIEVLSVPIRYVLTRVVYLHTLVHGSVSINVIDLHCPSCTDVILFDEVTQALFCLNKNNTFTQEPLINGTGTYAGQVELFATPSHP